MFYSNPVLLCFSANNSKYILDVQKSKKDSEGTKYIIVIDAHTAFHPNVTKPAPLCSKGVKIDCIPTDDHSITAYTAYRLGAVCRVELLKNAFFFQMQI